MIGQYHTHEKAGKFEFIGCPILWVKVWLLIKLSFLMNIKVVLLRKQTRHI